MSAGNDRLRAAFGGPETAWIRDRVRRHVAAGRDLPATVRHARPTDAERRAAAGLLGVRVRGAGAVEVDLRTLQAVLVRSGAWTGDLVGAVEALDGPIAVRSVEREREEQAWDAAFAPLVDAARSSGRAGLQTWVGELRARPGRLRLSAGSTDGAADLLRDLAAVVRSLPARGEPQPAFAARVVGRAHALDDGTPLGTWAVRAAEIIGGVPLPLDDAGPADRRRDAWASVGVLRDELSSTVLALGLPAGRDTATGRILEEARHGGQPVALTLRQLVRDPARLDVAGRTVSICENPAVVAAAADRHGEACSPIVCVAGQPGTAAIVLLRALRDAGAELRHHGDFDGGGVSIAGYLTRRFGVAPWRFGASDYRRAVAARSSTERAWPPDRAFATPWDPELGIAMAALGARVEEEHVLDDLMEDLADAP